MRLRSALPLLLALLLLAPLAPDAVAQQRAEPPVGTPVVDGRLPERPLPHPVPVPPYFQEALANQTRDASGAPGAAYWQQRADYRIDARLDPTANRLRGSVAIDYQNNSPEELPVLVLKLRQNLHRPDALRNRPVPLTDGIAVSNVRAAGVEHREVDRLTPASYLVDGTVMAIGLPAPLAPGASVTLSMDFQFEVPPEGAPRMGQDGEVWFVGYWYPQMAVFDDVRGWHTDPYMGLGEHYMGYGDYDVRITVPHGWIVGATGTLQNAEAVLDPRARARLAEAASGDAVVQVVAADERGTMTASGDSLTWRFRAENVRDFAFATSDQYVWDATRAAVGDLSGDGRTEYAIIHSLYRPGTQSWERSAEFGRFSIEHLSEMLFPYPYPQMTSVEGLIGGGMEYPMITLIGGARSDHSLFSVTYHEIAHMWYPMIVGTDEKSYTWMDEGMTSYNTNVGFEAFWNQNRWDEELHYRLANSGIAEPPMRHNDQYSTTAPIARFAASYSTPAVLLRALEGIVGTDAFFEAYNEYGRRWAFKHPYPWDFFHTMEDVLGIELDWLWWPTLYDTWTVDHAVANVTASGDGFTVTVEDLGLAPMPVFVVGTYADGSVERATIPVDVWLAGATTATTTLPAGDLERVELDPERWLPDVDRSNNAAARPPAGWVREREAGG
jgi:hypothetical protein